MPLIVSSQNAEREFRKRTVPSARIFLPELLISLMTDHADIGAEDDREVMGLIIGKVYRDNGGEYAIGERIVTGNLIADATSVRFDTGDGDDLVNAIDSSKGDVIGWYHSHIDLGCFMSVTDIATQDGIFAGECGFAVVIDPIRKEMKIFDSTVGGPKPVDMVIME